MSDFDTERMCRLNGKQPTAREKFRALYRLWRISRRHGSHQDMAADECFRVLFRDWSLFQLFEGSTESQLVNAKRFPLYFRKRFAGERLRKRNLEKAKWANRDKETAQLVLEMHGDEVTPNEVSQIRRKVVTTARATAAELGMRVPADDELLLRMLRRPVA